MQRYGFRPQLTLAGRHLNDGMGKHAGQEDHPAQFTGSRGQMLLLGLTFKENLGGVTAVAPRSSRFCNSQSASNALSARSASNETPLINGATPFISCACPGSSRNRTRLPSASINATILAVSHPLSCYLSRIRGRQ